MTRCVIGSIRCAIPSGDTPPEPFHVLTATVPGEADPAGFLKLDISTPKGHDVPLSGWINLLFVREESRGEGVAAALIERAAEIARAEGCRSMGLAVTHDNPARALYGRLGFLPAWAEGHGESLICHFRAL